MTEGAISSKRFLPLIRRECDKFLLMQGEKDRLVGRLLQLAGFLDTKGGQRSSGGLWADSSVFDFSVRLAAIVDHFAASGLTAEGLRRAVVKQPPLFFQSPATLAASVEGVVAHFSADGLTTSNYVAAALKQPPLFYQAPATIIANVEGVVGHFRDHGLTLAAYLRAGLKQPSLFCQSSGTIIRNIEGVADHFCHHGLTVSGYLGAATKQSPLFYQSPATIIANIEGVAEHFREHGMVLSDYLRAAVRQPPLFYQSPATIIRHIDHVINMHRLGLVTFPARGPIAPEYPLQPMFDFLVSKPMLFCLSDENYALREAYGKLALRRHKGTALLTRQRHLVERDYAAVVAGRSKGARN